MCAELNPFQKTHHGERERDRKCASAATLHVDFLWCKTTGRRFLRLCLQALIERRVQDVNQTVFVSGVPRGARKLRKCGTEHQEANTPIFPAACPCQSQAGSHYRAKCLTPESRLLFHRRESRRRGGFSVFSEMLRIWDGVWNCSALADLRIYMCVWCIYNITGTRCPYKDGKSNNSHLVWTFEWSSLKKKKVD